MHADYIANPLYDSNPFIEALPPMLSGSSPPSFCVASCSTMQNPYKQALLAHLP